MEKKQRMFYFGTQGSPGHFPLPIDSDVSDVTGNGWVKFDGAMPYWIAEHGTYSQGKLFGSEWSVYAVPWSADDEREMCHTDFLWEGEHTKEEMEAYIRKDPFLFRQFKFKLDASRVHDGSFVNVNDKYIAKVHHVDEEGRVHYHAYIDYKGGYSQGEPYADTCGLISECCVATQKQKYKLRMWIFEHKKKTKE